MMWLYTVLGVTIGIWIVLGWYVFARIKENYRRNGVFTDKLLITWYVMWAFHHVPVVLASVWAVWSIPLNRTLALTAGSVVFLGGLVILPMGMLEFRSLRRSTGQDISRLITSGIYRWSRNPQFVGWFLILLGISLAGRSGFALVLTIVFMAVLHGYTIWLAEPYLERLYGEAYRRYRSATPRYIGIPRDLAR